MPRSAAIVVYLMLLAKNRCPVQCRLNKTLGQADMNSIHINEVTRKDARDLIAANFVNREFHAPWSSPFTDVSGFEGWFSRMLPDRNVSLVARVSSTNEIVGVINITEIVMGVFQSAYLGYYGTSQFARQGLMTEALSLAIKYGFEDLGLHRLEANIQPGNTASLALVKKLHFVKEGFSRAYLQINGEWRDHERWALLHETVTIVLAGAGCQSVEKRIEN